MIMPMTTTARLQHRYDHRLRELVQGTGDVTIATDLGVPRSTARGWLGKAPTVVVSLDVTDLKAVELRQEVLELRRRVTKLMALLRLTLALLRSSGFTLAHERLPDGRAKVRILKPWIVPVRLFRCGCSCGFCDCPRVGSMPGDACNTRVRLMIGRLVRTRRPID